MIASPAARATRGEAVRLRVLSRRSMRWRVGVDMTLRAGWAFGLALSFAAGCGSSHDGTTDAFVPDVDAGARDAAASDAGAPDGGIDARVPEDAASPDGGSDAGAIAVDAGVTCTAAASCGARSCGRSACGASCGECDMGFECDREGTCTTTPVGTSCVDAFGETVAYGAQGFRVCPTDPEQMQRCYCSAGEWSACDPCMLVVLDGQRGDRCATDSHCADAVPCHPSLRLCGERCDRGLGTECPAGTICGIPGDVAGACLPECETCGTGCDDTSTCRRGESGNVCAPSGYAWAPSC